jgi:hypothetical protein
MPREARVVVVAPKCAQAPSGERHDQFEIAFSDEFALNKDWVTHYPVDVSSICGERKRPVPAMRRSGVTPEIDHLSAGTGDYLQPGVPKLLSIKVIIGTTSLEVSGATLVSIAVTPARCRGQDQAGRWRDRHEYPVQLFRAVSPYSIPLLHDYSIC